MPIWIAHVCRFETGIKTKTRMNMVRENTTKSLLILFRSKSKVILSINYMHSLRCTHAIPPCTKHPNYLQSKHVKLLHVTNASRTESKWDQTIVRQERGARGRDRQKKKKKWFDLERNKAVLLYIVLCSTTTKETAGRGRYNCISATQLLFKKIKWNSLKQPLKSAHMHGSVKYHLMFPSLLDEENNRKSDG